MQLILTNYDKPLFSGLFGSSFRCDADVMVN